jgi:hypothetical protein
MAKKKQSKKHKFKYSEPTSALDGQSFATGTTSGDEKLSATIVKARESKASQPAGRDFSYVVGDLRRILILGSSLVIAELALWFLFSHTGLGSSVYSLIKV